VDKRLKLEEDWVDDFFEMPSNEPREKDKECVCSHEIFVKHIQDLLVRKLDYYSWCNKCIGSKDDLKPFLLKNLTVELRNSFI
jgi:hypothetical protein